MKERNTENVVFYPEVSMLNGNLSEILKNLRTPLQAGFTVLSFLCLEFI
jgi:hypothetical protein